MSETLPPMLLKESDRQIILDHCRDGLPYEACGLVFGKGREAIRVLPMENVARSTTFYSLDPLEQMRQIDAARDDGLDLIGIFHSHPVTRPYPSRTDVEFAGFWEDCWFLIASFRHDKPELCCYRIVNERIIETGIETLSRPHEQWTDLA